MKDRLVFSFRTVKADLDEDVFIFGKLREDLEKFVVRIKEENPKFILGIGNASFTRYERRAVNCFHGKAIIKGGREFYDLHIPEKSSSVSLQTESFCNWVTYRVAHFVTENKMHCQISFLHLNKVKNHE